MRFERSRCLPAESGRVSDVAMSDMNIFVAQKVGL